MEFYVNSYYESLFDVRFNVDYFLYLYFNFFILEVDFVDKRSFGYIEEV